MTLSGGIMSKSTTHRKPRALRARAGLFGRTLVAGVCLAIAPANGQEAGPAEAPKPAAEAAPAAAPAPAETVAEKVATPENGATVKSEPAAPAVAPAPAPAVAPAVAPAPAPDAKPALTAPAPLPAATAPALPPAWVIGIYPNVPEGEVVVATHTVAAPTTAAEMQPAAYYPCPPARMSYKDAYDQIPFSRAEYEANPGYRHEAAMELVFGVQRPTTIVKQTAPYFSRYPDFQRNRLQVYPYPWSMPNRFDINHHYFQQWYW
jgi:hypothetical protein